MKTKVIFRQWRDGEIIALFPELPACNRGYDCMSYEHNGQHGGADYTHCIRITKPAVKDDYRWLAQELLNIGYVLDIKTRAGRDALDKRRAGLAQ